MLLTFDVHNWILVLSTELKPIVMFYHSLDLRQFSRNLIFLPNQYPVFAHDGELVILVIKLNTL